MAVDKGLGLGRRIAGVSGIFTAREYAYETKKDKVGEIMNYTNHILVVSDELTGDYYIVQPASKTEIKANRIGKLLMKRLEEGKLRTISRLGEDGKVCEHNISVSYDDADSERLYGRNYI